MINPKLYLSLLLIITPLSLEAEPQCDQWIARLISAKGKVEKLAKNQSEWQPVRSYDFFCYGDKIRTFKHSTVKLKFIIEPATTIVLEQNSTLTFPNFDNSPQLPFNLLEGSILWFVRIFSNYPESLSFL